MNIKMKKYGLLLTVTVVTVVMCLFGYYLNSKAADSLQSKRYSADSGCEISIKELSSWKESKQYGTVVSVDIYNTGKDIINDWNMRLEFDEKVVIQEIWCAKETVSDNNIDIVALDYNKQINSNSGVNYGFILKSDAEFDMDNIKIYFNDILYSEIQDDKDNSSDKAEDVNDSNTNSKDDADIENESNSSNITNNSESNESDDKNNTSNSGGSSNSSVNSDASNNSSNLDDSGSRYFTEKLSAQEMISRSEKISKKEVKQLLYNEIDEHWDVLSKELNQKDKKKVYALFLGFATRESTLNAGLETGQGDGFGVNPAHAYGPLQTAVTAFAGCNESFTKEDDVPELYQYQWNEANFYDPVISTHMGVRKFIHFIREAREKYGLKDVDIVKGALKGFNTGHANYEANDTSYNSSYPNEIAALGGWYYENNHYNDDVFTWTSDEKVDRSDCWSWWK